MAFEIGHHVPGIIGRLQGLQEYRHEMHPPIIDGAVLIGLDTTLTEQYKRPLVVETAPNQVRILPPEIGKGLGFDLVVHDRTDPIQWGRKPMIRPAHSLLVQYDERKGVVVDDPEAPLVVLEGGQDNFTAAIRRIVVHAKNLQEQQASPNLTT